MVQDRIDYSISFLTDWHAGSGLSAGAEADAVVIKDSYGFPYIPGKTIKGLFVDAFRDFESLKIEGFGKETTFNRLFGNMDKDTKATSQGTLFFSNVSLPKKEIVAIGQDHVDYLYRNISSSAIDSQTGVAKPASLRVMEVCVPLVLEGYIDGAKETDRLLIDQLTKYIRNIGASRNRGLGRCSIKLK
jgi:CRISPR/Cas system CSM-associated protein Csm3 (group 7 of RAMP superfamily)